MKEAIRQNNIKPNGLTNPDQTSYARGGPRFDWGGDIFMAEPGQGEIKTNNEPYKDPNPAFVKPQRSGSPKVKIGRTPSVEEKDNIAQTAAALDEFSSAPEWNEPRQTFQNQSQQEAKETPEQEAVRIRREESGGVKTFAQLNTINTSEVFDPVLHQTALRFNRRLRRGLMPDQDIDQTIKDFESRLDEPTIQNNERTLIEDTIDQMEVELMTRRDLQRIQYEEREKYGSLYGERKLTSQERDVIKDGVNTQEIDRLFNRMFDRVDSNPREEFGGAFGTPGQLEYEEFIRTLNEVVTDEQATPPQKDTARELVRRYSEERKVRQVTHDVNYAILSGVGTEKLVGFIQGFDSSQADLAFSKKGVVSAFHFYEQALLKIKAENGGFLPEYEVIGDPKSGTIGKAESLARKYLNAQVGDTMADWEKNRAISLARGMGIITGRFIEISASSILPGKRAVGNPVVGERFVSMYAQDVIRDIAPFRHLIYKFDIGKERNRVFAFLLNRENAPWKKEELEDFKWDKMIDVLNGLTDDNKERFLSNLNPFQVGGILSRTTWRLGDNPTTGALGDFLKEGRESRINQFKTTHNIETSVDLTEKRAGINYDKFLSEAERKENKHASSEDVTAINAYLSAFPGTAFEEGDVRIKNIQNEFNEDANWIGTGVQIELSRNALKSKKDLDEIKKPEEREAARKGSEEAEQKIRASLQKVAKLQPLKLFYNLPDLQKKVLNGRDLKTDTVLQGDLDKLVILQEKAFNNKAGQLEFEDNEEGRRLRGFAEEVRKNFNENQFVENLRNREWKLPFNFGTEDVPFDKYVFAKAGGSAIARRWRDIASAKKAVDGTLKLVSGMDSFKNPAAIVPILREIYGGIAGYDEDLARRVTLKFAEGVTRFYSKDVWSRLPFGIGTLNSLVNRGSSYAEVAFGKGQMAWDELAVNEFSRQLRDQGLLTLDQQHKLQGKVGGNKIAVVAAYARTLTPLIGLAIAVYILKETFEEEKQ